LEAKMIGERYTLVQTKSAGTGKIYHPSYCSRGLTQQEKENDDMRDVYVTSDVMATLFLTDKEMERNPEPIRMQQSVMLNVEFEEYIDFCKTYLNVKDYLSTPTVDIKRFLDIGDEESLLKCFYKDMAVAVGKEIHYAETYRKSATKFYHIVKDPSKIYTQEDICAIAYQFESVALSFLIPYLRSRDFGLPSKPSKSNIFMWNYMMLLGWYGMALSSKWMYKKS
jgi:hypothetical protein